MKARTKTILKRIGIAIGILLLIAACFGFYLYSIIPKPIGKPIVLQQELFTKPAQELPISGKFIYKSASELASMIRNHEATSLEITREFIANIKNNNYKYNAIIWLREKEALEDAQKADEAVARGAVLGPLHGVPITIKEMFWVKGSPSTMNAKMFGFTAPYDCPLVQQLRKSGAIILGTTNVPYMLSDYQTQGELYPTASNPYDTTRTPGGSTGGGAAALAAGFTTLELGSDMGGSIRVPAVFCGLYSLKATFGTLNISEGTGPDTITKFTRFAMASPGPLARRPEDLSLMWNSLVQARADKRFQHPVSWKPASDKNLGQYRLAWMDEWKRGDKTVHVGTDVREKLQMLLDSLQRHGVRLDKKTPDTYSEMMRSFLGSFAGMMSEGQPWLLRKFMKMDMQRLGDGTSDVEALNESLDDASDAHWQKLQADREQLIKVWDDFFRQYDFLICPVSYGPAITKCPSGTPIQTEGSTVPYMAYFPYAGIFNATGHPCVTIPLGLNKVGLPVGVQIVGPYYSEPELLHLTELISRITPGFIRPKG